MFADVIAIDYHYMLYNMYLSLIILKEKRYLCNAIDKQLFFSDREQGELIQTICNLLS